MFRRLTTWAGRLGIMVLCSVLIGCTGTSTGTSGSTSDPTNSNSTGGIPGSFWGMIVNQPANFPVQLPYGQYRIWDNSQAQWVLVEKCKAASGDPNDACFDWSDFDILLSSLHSVGVNDILMTMSRTPNWAVDLSADPTGQNGLECNYYVSGTKNPSEVPGQCLLPIDINADGSGTDQIWKNWISAAATRANDATYLQTHSHIKYWEPWNEYYRSTVLNNYVGSQSFEGTYAQLVRLTEDMRCIITGKGTIHNYPTAGQSTPCNAKAIDASAQIVAPSSVTYSGGMDVVQNFLYCNGTGIHAPVAGSNCSTGSAGSQAIDIVNFHFYATTTTPERVASGEIQNVRAMLSSTDKGKPLINGEGSWSDPSRPGMIWGDPYSQAGFIPRFFAMYWSAGLALNYWYAYDNSIGMLFDPNSGKLLEPQATAWKVTSQWLVGAVPTNSPFCSVKGTVYTCDFTETGGGSAELVWDTQYGQNCSQMSQPIICGATNYSVPAQFNKDWIDLSGTTHQISSTVTIGANPILLEAQ